MLWFYGWLQSVSVFLICPSNLPSKSECSPNIIWFYKKTFLYLEIVFILNKIYIIWKVTWVNRYKSSSPSGSFGQGILFPAYLDLVSGNCDPWLIPLDLWPWNDVSLDSWPGNDGPWLLSVDLRMIQPVFQHIHVDGCHIMEGNRKITAAHLSLKCNIWVNMLLCQFHTKTLSGWLISVTIMDSGGSKGGARDARSPPPRGPNSFDFMQFGENLAKLYVGAPPLGSWRPLLGEILDRPLMELPYPKALKLFLGFLTSVSSLMYFYKDDTVTPLHFPSELIQYPIQKGEVGRHCVTWYSVGR